MNLTQTAPTTIDASAPASFTCAECPFARHIDGNRYCCQVSQTASDVKRGHWEATVSCFEALAQAKAEAEKAEAPIAPTVTESAPTAPIAPESTPTAAAKIPAPVKQSIAKTDAPAPTTPAAIETDNQPPGRGDGGRGRILPAKKLMPSIVPVARITSDIPASNFDQFELEVLGELSLAIGGFVLPPVLVRDSGGYRVVSGHLQYHAAVLARRLNPRAGETIPVFVLEAENQSVALAQLRMLKAA